MQKPVKKTLSVKQLTSKLEVNVREANNYDLPAMCQQIVVAGRIHTSVIAEEVNGEYNILQGHRRVRAGQMLLNDHPLITGIFLNIADNEKDAAKRESIKKNIVELTGQVVDQLGKVEVMVYKGLTEEERLTLILDHGSMKPICRTEVVNTCWRMDRQFFSEGDIIRVAYFALAKFTGNERKLSEVPSDTKAREQFLRKWLHGTVGNFILAAHKMGDYVREQFILTHRAEDGLLNNGEKVEMRCSRDRITQLSAAKTADKEVWTPEKGSPKFNELIKKFKDEDAGLSEADKKKRPSAKELNDKADVFKTPAIRKALLIAAGETGDRVAGLIEDDDQMYNDQQKLKIVSAAWETLPKQLKEFATHLLHDTPLLLNEYLQSIAAK